MNGSSHAPEYRRFAPSPGLGRVAEAVWVQDCVPDPGAAPTTVLPGGRVDLAFFYGDRFARLDDGTAAPMPRAQVVGQLCQPVSLQALGRTGIVIVRLKPWGAAALFGADLGETTNRVVDLELLWSRSRVRSFLEQLADATTPAERARLADVFVTRRVRRDDTDPLAAEAVQAINAGWGCQPIALLARQFGLGRRQFHRRFVRSVGIGPKLLSQVLRVQKAAACLRVGIDTQSIIARCGYSDQSHFIRDVVQYCGKRPSELIRLAPSATGRFFNTAEVAAFCGLTYL